MQFADQAPWNEVTRWLQSLEAEVLGPDDEGLYLVMGKDIDPDLLEASPWVVRVESLGGGDEE